MPKYIVRVELHDASEPEYERLHEDMEAAGFHRTIDGLRDNDGAPDTWQLPMAEYYTESPLSPRDVRERVCGIAAVISAMPAVLVTEAGAICWSGLDTA